MAAANLEDVYELSSMQQGILFHTLYDPAGDLYFEQCVVTLRGEVDAARFARAWQAVAARQTILKTSIHWEGLEKPVQVVHREVEVPFQFFDWSDLPPEVQRIELEAFLREDRKRSFDLATPPLLRLALFQKGDSLHECVLSFQHLLLDRWSRILVLKEALAEYAGGVERDSLPAPRPYREYIAWLQEQDRGGAEAFWRRALAGFTTPTPVGSRPSGEASSGIFEEASLRLSPEATAHLQSFARRNRLTMNTLVQGAWAILTSRYSGEEDVLFGATVSGRPASLPDIESMVGLFINTLPVRVRVTGEDRLLPWLQKLQTWLLELRQYEHSSLLDVQGWSEVPRGTPLFESLVVFENIAGESGALGSSGPLEVLRVRSIGGGTNYPLTLFAFPGSELSLRILADRGLSESVTILGVLENLATLLQGMVADPDRPLSRLPLLTEQDRRKLLYEWNDTARDYPEGETLVGIFEAQVDRTPERIALVSGRERLTYRELDRRSNRIAQRLARDGVEPGTLVGVCTERSPEMVAGILGILKAGGAYVPLDPAYPRRRLELMLDDAGISHVLTQERLTETLSFGGAQLLRLDADSSALSRESEERLGSRASPTGLAYVIYTSGSTGTPKGVSIEHRNAVALAHWARDVFPAEDLAGVLASTSICFDLSVFELFVPLAWGGTVILAQNVLELPTLPGADAVTLINTVPSAMTELLRLGDLPGGIRTVNLAGEPLPSWLVRQVFAQGRVQRVFDLYGPSEDTVYSTSAERSPEGPSTIGRPIANKQAYILDASLEPVPVGVAGDLYVGGAGVARGYLNRPELTAERFLPDPFRATPGARIYRTGDRARYASDGTILFLGRLDHQVKIRGYRIELEEIQAEIKQYPGVRAAVVLVREERGDKELVAYLVMEGGLEPSVTQLRGFLKQKLPEYMAPSAFVFLDALPLTPNGKVDRRALPEPDRTRTGGEGLVLPRTSVERELTEIWKDILKLDRVGIEDNFFELGGHSLLATRLVSRIAECFSVRLPLRRIFEDPTLEQFSLVIANALAEQERPESLLEMLAEVRALSDDEARDRLDAEAGPAAPPRIGR